MGFLWGSVVVSPTVGFLWGSQEPLTYLADQIPGIQVLQLLHAVINLRVTQRGRDSLTRERWFRAYRRLFTIVIGDKFLIVAHADHPDLGVAR